MPYIRPEQRNSIGAKTDPLSPGELNYLITAACHEQIIRKGLSYRVVNEVIGVLECAKLELYRMIAAPYEDKKLLDNGCISELDKRPHWTDGRSG